MFYFTVLKKVPNEKKVDARKFGYDYKVYRVHKQQGKSQGRFLAYGGKLRSLELSGTDFLLIVFVSKVKVVNSD